MSDHGIIIPLEEKWTRRMEERLGLSPRYMRRSRSLMLMIPLREIVVMSMVEHSLYWLSVMNHGRRVLEGV